MPDTDQDQDNKPLHGPNLILDVENFGPIAEAKNIEFRPMTVFVGPSNTGKTYLATLLHAILKAKNGDPLRPNAVPPSVADDFYGLIDQYELHEVISEIRSFAEALADRRSRLRSIMRADQMPPGLKCFVASATNSWLNSLATRTVDELSRYFQRDFMNLVRSDAKDQNLTVEVFSDTRDWSVTLSSDMEHRTTVQIDVDLIIDRGLRSALLRFDDDGRSTNRFVESRFIDALDASIERNMNSFVRSHYAPAGRTGILASQPVLTSVIIAAWESSGFDRLEIGQLKPVVGEFLRSLLTTHDTRLDRRITIDERSRLRRPTMANVAQLMEAEVLGGRILKANGAVDDGSYLYETDSFLGPLDSASSMVTEIAPLVLAIRNEVRLGELVIIDEPEAHLHPEAQQKMAATLAHMVRRGMRVLITTHSDYFVEQLGIFHNASFLDHGTRAATLKCFGPDLDAELFLHGDEIGVYGFNQLPGGSGTTVTEVQFDEELWEYGTSDHTAAVHKQFNRNSRVMAARMERE